MGIIKKIAGHIFATYAALAFVATMLLVWLPIFFVSLLPEPRRAKMLHPIFKLWMTVYLNMIFCPVKRVGASNFAKGENYIVVLNHNSMMDIPVSSPWIPGANKTLAKMEMAKIPLFGLIYKTGSILVDRKNEASRRGSFGQMQQTLEAGIHLCLYPEGTRNKTAAPLQPFFDGAFNIALKTGKPMIPGLIFNTRKILPNKPPFWLQPKPIEIHFLPPIPTAHLTLKDLPALKEQVHQVMEEYYIKTTKA